MQVGFAITAGDAVQRNERVVPWSGKSQQQIGLLIVGAVQLGVAKDLVGPEAAFTAIARLAPEEQPGVLLLQSLAGSGERLDG
ncbi:hypothetical protein D3C85_1494090 [compost metagenome]